MSWRSIPPLTCLLVTLQSCVVTNALWHEETPVYPLLNETRLQFAVDEVRGDLTPNPATTAIELRYRGHDGSATATAARPAVRAGRILLRPSLFDTRWLFAARPDVRPETWDFEVFGGDGFLGRPSFNARVNMRGHAPRSLIGRRLTDEASSLAQLSPPRPNLMSPPWEFDALVQVDGHDWSALLGGDHGHTITALGWIDRHGQPIGALAAETDPTAAELVVSIAAGDDDTAALAAIPATTLLAADDLEFERDGDTIAWRYSAIWRATHEASRDLPPFDPQLSSALFDYHWSTFAPDGTNPFTLLAKIVATPLAAAVDLLAFVNPHIGNFVHYVLGIEPPERWQLPRRD